MDIFDEMTKEEIIDWVRGRAAYPSHLPNKTNLLYQRWQTENKELYDRRMANIEYGNSIGLSKRDELTKQFNATKNINEKFLLLRKMKPYEEKWQKYITESDSIMEEEKRVNKLYSLIEVERKKE